MKLRTKQKLIPTVAMLIVSALLMSTASYAWFTLSKEVTVEGVNLTAVAPDNLLISKDMFSGYNVSVSLVPGTDFGTGALNPASSYDGKTFFYTGNTMIEGQATASAVFIHTLRAIDNDSASTDGYYLQIPLFLVNTGSSQVDININLLNSIVANATANDNIASAVRYSVTHDANKDGVADASENTKMFGLIGDVSDPFWITNVNYLTSVVGPVQNSLDNYTGTTDAISWNLNSSIVSIPANGRADLTLSSEGAQALAKLRAAGKLNEAASVVNEESYSSETQAILVSDAAAAWYNEVKVSGSNIATLLADMQAKANKANKVFDNTGIVITTLQSLDTSDIGHDISAAITSLSNDLSDVESAMNAVIAAYQACAADPNNSTLESAATAAVAALENSINDNAGSGSYNTRTSLVNQTTSMVTSDRTAFDEYDINNSVAIIINVWIEGQDNDCVNAQVGDSFNLNLMFDESE